MLDLLHYSRSLEDLHNVDLSEHHSFTRHFKNILRHTGTIPDNIIVTSWNYGTRNWIYVVLSRVRTLAGLHLLQKLNDTVNFSPHARLLEEERRLKQLEAAFFSNGRQLPENNE
mmetsp:Transcript_1618/g.3127  ORF Transcript_1618/g.3127 Transcript_1618/m.3127 type:complete len:114 (-) Transcript_1618:65-406(-)